ncbi:MAG: MBL fold metallo-hydrolase [Alicyclobacillaceae bacterium]|nr:MBL fold metallo-hydrolase [Alicyclobacillaceae bacterium]
MIDLLEQGRRCRTAAYLIRDRQPTLVETGSARSHEVLLAGLRAAGVEPDELAYVIVTHVHLDHAGGAGHLLQTAKRAKLVVHPRGARHLVNPSKLWQGTVSVYGERASELFGSILPVPEERLWVPKHGDTLAIGRRTLQFYDAPGHAKHHHVILDAEAGNLYAGDALGVRYNRCFTGWPFEWIMATTSPPDFDPAAMRQTAAFLQQLPFHKACHGHFGVSGKDEACAETIRTAEAMAAFARESLSPGMPLASAMQLFREWVAADLRTRGREPGPDLSVLDTDVYLDTLGLLHYEERRRSGSG